MLLEFLKKYGQAQPDGTTMIKLPLNREEMANYIGVTRETLSRKLSALKEAGVIDIIGNKQLKIINAEVLAESCHQL